MHNKKLHNLYTSSNIRFIKSKRMRWAWRVACVGATRSACRIFVEKPEGKRPLPLGRPMRGWENNIEMVVRKIGLENVNLNMTVIIQSPERQGIP